MADLKPETAETAASKAPRGIGLASTMLSVAAIGAAGAVAWASGGEDGWLKRHEKLSGQVAAVTIAPRSDAARPSVFSASTPLLAVAAAGASAATSKVVTTVPSGSAPGAHRADAIVAPIQRVRPKTPVVASAKAAPAAARSGKLSPPAYSLGAGAIAKSALAAEAPRVKVKIACKAGLVADKAGTRCIKPPAKAAR